MSSRFKTALLGARDTIPMLVGALPFGIIFGTLAVSSGLSAGATLAMSALVFAGSAQFIAISLIASGTGLVVILLTTLIVNLRHMLYSASMLPYVRHLPQRWRVPLAFWLTDESFAVVHRYYQNATVPLAGKQWYFFGSCLAMYSNWFACTLVGVLLGHALPGMAHWGLDFAMVATFIGIVVPLLRTRPMLVAALVAAVVAVAANGLPYKLGLMLAALLGVIAGVIAARLQPKVIYPEQDQGVTDESL
ncbi:AzlC family ABC transporter permease [Halopseudomonas pelagia]|uniref:Branched-chain amino acid ABC transporter permease n=1 Tax=Halopseudomonas pelagia TaxID=553151 RepID=A0AA91Z587_9GAMM|nr:AzlC family ABC transporter permease [Halopseudomonas pelagia]PCC98476.1 branched-chain amino acid ABC transporter permease [Halopseudomonas pelagia]QFY56120.1 branched-chain amino acid ABC transporter permease [Halopseudomonas pelagia]